MLIVLNTFIHQTEAADIVVNPTPHQDNAEFLGYPTTYLIQNLQAGFPASVTWAIQENDAYCVSGWLAPANLNNSTIQLYFTFPCTIKIQCTINYSSAPGPGGQPINPPVAQEVANYSVTIPPPDDVVASNTYQATPLNLSTDPQPTATSPNGSKGYYLKLPLRVGAKSIGGQIAFTAQEQITNITQGGNALPDRDITPFPPTNTNGLFYVGVDPTDRNSYIWDWKILNIPAPFKSVAVGILSTYTQEVFITFNDLTGALHAISLGKRNYDTFGINNGNNTATTWETQD